MLIKTKIHSFYDAYPVVQWCDENIGRGNYRVGTTVELVSGEEFREYAIEHFDNPNVLGYRVLLSKAFVFELRDDDAMLFHLRWAGHGR